MEKYLIAKYDTYGREPIIRKAKDGTLLCLSLSGGEREPDNQNVVLLTKSYDRGQTWDSPQILFSHLKRGCWATELFCDGTRDFAVVHTYNAATWYKELQTFRSFCDDNGENWTEPVTMRGITNCSVRQGITMSNGEILFPVYWQETRSGFAYKNNFDIDGAKYPFVSGVAVSSDKGETFYRYGYISSAVSLWEPNAVEAEDGHIILYCRCCEGHLYISESFDYGKSWSEGYISDIPNADTKVTVLKVNGHILMINNFNSFGERENLCIYKSKDGKTFEKITNIEDENEHFFYPHAFADEKERILYIAYENTKEHWLKKYTFEELGIE